MKWGMESGEWEMKGWKHGGWQVKGRRLASNKAALESEWGDEWNAETKQMKCGNKVNDIKKQSKWYKETK